MRQLHYVPLIEHALNGTSVESALYLSLLKSYSRESTRLRAHTISSPLILAVSHTSRQFHIITFPDTFSGSGRSTPQAQIFPTQLASALWGETSLTTLLPALSIPGNVGLTLAKGEVSDVIFGQNAASYLRHINTPNMAADMLQIVKAHGREKLNYYGYSCVSRSCDELWSVLTCIVSVDSAGTILGTTFATMYPDKIERMVLDGVVDAEQWYTGGPLDYSLIVRG